MLFIIINSIKNDLKYIIFLGHAIANGGSVGGGE